MFDKLVQVGTSSGFNWSILLPQIILASGTIAAGLIVALVTLSQARENRRRERDQFAEQMNAERERFRTLMEEERRRLRVEHRRQIYSKFSEKLQTFPEHSRDITTEDFNAICQRLSSAFSTYNLFLDDETIKVFEEKIMDDIDNLIMEAQTNPREASLELEKRVQMIRIAMRRSIEKMEQEV